MTLMALGICIGTLVTNSIVVLENIARLVQSDMPPHEAAAKGTSQVAVAVLAATLTNIVVFTPIAFMSGIVGRFFLQFGLTVVFATIFSLIVSFTMVPMLAARLVKPGKGIGKGAGGGLIAGAARAWDRGYDSLENGYRRVLAHCLEHRRRPILAALAILIGATALFRWVGGEFVPTVDDGTMLVKLEFPAGTSLSRSVSVAERLGADLRREPEVTGVLVKAGGENRGIEDVDILLTLTDKRERDVTLLEFIARIRPRLAQIPDAEVTVFQTGGIGHVESDLVLEVVGEDYAAITAVSGELRALMGGIPGLVDVQTSRRPGKPVIQIEPNREYLAAHNLTTAQVGRILRTAYEGEKAGAYREGGEEYDVVVRLSEKARSNPSVLPDLPVATPMGRTVPLSEVMTFTETEGDATIMRTDKMRLVQVTANIAEGSLSEKRALIDAGMAGIAIPAGVRVQYGGMAEHQDESFRAIFEALILAVLLLYIVMAAILESFIHPLTVMVTLPLSLIGMAVALFLTGQNINILSLMALVMMVGIVVNNAILMLDQTSQERAAGAGIKEALLTACPMKLRPIIIANLAIAIGMIPQAVGTGPGAEYRVPMAVVQMGGVIFSSIFTLFVIPPVYTLLDRFSLAGRRERRAE